MNRNMMRQAQKQLAQLQKIQDELETLKVEGTAGGLCHNHGEQHVAAVTVGEAAPGRKIQFLSHQRL